MTPTNAVDVILLYDIITPSFNFNGHCGYQYGCRGANPLAVDCEDKTPLQLVTESDMDDVEILALMKKTKR